MKQAFYWLFSVKGFRNKYLTPVITTAFLLICFNVFSQTHSPYDSTRNPLRQFVGGSFDWNGGQFKHLILPRDTIKLKYSDSGAIAYKSDKYWKFNGRFWTEASGSGGGTQDLNTTVGYGNTTPLPFGKTDGTDLDAYLDGGSDGGVFKAKDNTGPDSAYYGAKGVTFLQADNSLTIKPVALGGTNILYAPDKNDTIIVSSDVPFIFPDNGTCQYIDTSTRPYRVYIDTACLRALNLGGGGSTTLQQAFDNAPTDNPQINAHNNSFNMDSVANMYIVSPEYTQGFEYGTGYTGLFTPYSSIYAETNRINIQAVPRVDVGLKSNLSLLIDSFKAVFKNQNSFATDTFIKIGVNTFHPTTQLDVAGDTRFRNNGTPGSGKIATGTDADGNWTWQAGGGVTTMGTIDGAGTTNGASISGTTLRLAKVTSTTGGVLTIGADTIAGAKTWLGAQTFNSATNGVTINASPSNDGAILINRVLSNTNHGLIDQSTLGASPYSSKDENMVTAENTEHVYGHQSRITVSTGDTVSTYGTGRSQPTINGRIRHRHGWWYQTPGGSGGVGSNYAFKTDAITASQADSNFAAQFLGGRVLIAQSAVASANYGTLSLGNGPFDGTTPGFWVGSASGTQFAINAPAAFAGTIFDFQTGGANRLFLSGSGNLSVGGTIANSTSKINVHASAASTASSTRYSNGSIAATAGLDVGLTSSNTAQVMYIGAASLALGTNNTARLTLGASSGATFATNVITTGLATAYTATAVDLTATAAHHTINITADAKTVTLPTAASISGRIYTIKLTSAASTGTVATTSSQTIDGSTTYTLSAQYKYVTVQSDGANWLIVANN